MLLSPLWGGGCNGPSDGGFRSSEYATASERPRLEVLYVPPVPTSAPNPPTDLSAVQSDIGEVTVDFIDQSNDEDTFELERSENGGGFSHLITLDADTTFHVDSGLMDGVEYCYRVQADNAFASSIFRNTACVLVPAAP